MNRHYLIEFQSVGNSVKVSAIDPETGVEVSIVGPPNVGREILSRTAARKLDYVLRKRGLADKPKEDSSGRGRRGILI